MKALNKKDRIRKYNARLEEKAIITIDNGICSLEADVGVMGIQLKFKGTAQITPELPEGWILQGNNNTIIIFTLGANPIQNQTLFSYVGSVEIIGAIISNDKGERLSDKGTSSWEDYKDTKKVGKVKKTIYNLPDYDLPKVEKKTKIKRTQASSRSTGGY